MKMAAKIYEELNLKLFEFHECNRDTKKTERLMESMKKHGWINAYPMLCVRTGNGKLKIKDGHHRYEVALRLGIPVKYVIEEEDSLTLFEIDETTNPWTLEDHLTSQCRAGNIEYNKVKKYKDDTGIGINQAISMLYGQQAGSGNTRIMFKRGEFCCRDTKNAEVVGDIVRYMKKHGVSWAHHSTLVKALSKIAFVPEFSPTLLKEKIRTFSYLIEKRPHLDGYMEMIENLYNYRSRVKVPLKFLAEMNAKERHIIKKAS